MNLTHCPHCGQSWLGLELPFGLAETGHYATPEEAEEAAEMYGWTPENRRCFNEHVRCVKPLYSGHTFWECLTCKTYFHWVDDGYKAIPVEEVNKLWLSSSTEGVRLD